jgi:hypothetical protein
MLIHVLLDDHLVATHMDDDQADIPAAKRRALKLAMDGAGLRIGDAFRVSFQVGDLRGRAAELLARSN